MTQASAAFDRALVLVGIVALAVYCVFPTWMMGFPEPSVLWFDALWLVPAAIVVAGFVLRARLGGRVAVLVGCSLLIPVTLIFTMMLLTVLLAGCQVTLLAVGVLGLTGMGRLRWGFAKWAVILAAPVVLTGVLQAGVAVWVWPADQADPGAEAAGEFPVSFADGIAYEGPLVVGGVPSEIRGSFEMPLVEAMRAERSALEREGWSVSGGPPGETSGTMTARRSGQEATLTFEQDAGAESSGVGTVAVRVEPE